MNGRLLYPSSMRCFAVACLLTLAAGASMQAATVFEDGFEAGVLGNAWSVSKTADGRSTVSSDFEPASGARHLVLDDAVSDETNSVAEATLKFDFTFKKNVVLTFKAKSLGNEPHEGPTSTFFSTRSYDGVALSINGGSTWRIVRSLAAASSAWSTASIPLDEAASALGGKLGADVRIRFSAYDNSPAPEDGIAIDDVLITADEDTQSFVELPSPILEGTGPQTGYVLLTFTPTSDLTLNLNANPTGQLIMPAVVVVPAGQRSASFELSAADDTAVNLTRTISVTASASGVTANPGAITIYDDDAPVATLTLPAQLVEGSFDGYDNATLSINKAANQNLTMTISGKPAAFSLPGSVTIYAGQTSAKFTISPFNDSAITGNFPATITASAPGLQTASAQTTFVDNDPRALSLSVPAYVQEDAVATCTVSIPGTFPQDLLVNLNSSDASTAGVPANVVIRAGTTSATFLLMPQDNSSREGGRNITVAAQAETFTSASVVTTITDNEIAGYRATTATDIVDLAKPVSFTVSATDISGNAIGGANHTVEVEIVAPDGTTRPASPPTLKLTGATTTGTVTLPQDVAPPLRLRFRDANGNAGDSQFFDLLRVIPITAADVIWDATRGRFYASVPATAPAYAHQVVAIDPQTLQVTGSVTVGHNPGRLALTSGGEALYVALNANGKVARINPESMAVVSEFAVGQGQHGDNYYAYDICTVAGQPNLLIIVRGEGWGTNTWGAYVYDNGVRRPKGVGAANVEQSPDPEFFFGARSYGDLYRLRLDGDGLTTVLTNPNVYGENMTADGNLISTHYNAIDGATLSVRGSFINAPVSPFKAWRPDATANRFYFVEARSDSYGAPVDKIVAYNASSLAVTRRSTMPPVATAASFIRWGSNGLAFRSSDTINVIGAGLLVPTGEAADLAVQMQTSPGSVAAGQPITYDAHVTNHGPSVARNAVLTLTMSDGQRPQHVSASRGAPAVNGSVATLNIGDLQPGSTVSITLRTTPENVGSVSCTAQAASTSHDTASANDAAFKFVPVGFNPGSNVANELRLPVNNVLHDEARGILWATVGKSVAAPLGGSLIMIDPTTGMISDPLPLSGDPRSSCIALSPNGRYLYVGLNDAAAVVRVDLASTPYDFVRLPLGVISYQAVYPADIEVLEGDGRSFIVTARSSYGAAVYDDAVQRPAVISSLYTAERIERSAEAGRFVVVSTTISSAPASIVAVGPNGLSVEKTVQGVIAGDIRVSGNLLLSGGGQLADNRSLALKGNVGMYGQPCLDALNGRAYMVFAKELRAFDTTTQGAPAASFLLPVARSDHWSTACVRWGADGFAIAGLDKLYLLRWSAAAPQPTDQNGNQLSDAWELYYFGALGVDPAADGDRDGLANFFEYLFATSPLASNASPLQVRIEDVSQGQVIHLIYSRRAGIPPTAYSYEVSNELKRWNAATAVTESILSSEVVDGIQVETIDAAIAVEDALRGFARLKSATP